MFENIQYQNSEGFPNQEESMESLKLIFEVFDAYAKVQRKVDEIARAINSYDKRHMWDIMQKYLIEYRDLINDTKMFTNVVVMQTDEMNVYEVLSKNDIRDRLQWLISFIYSIDAVRFVADERAKHEVKTMMKNLGIPKPWLMLM